MKGPLRIPAAALATTLGTGFFPFGPGTVGSLVAAALFFFTPAHLRLPLLPVILLFGWAGCEAGRKMWGEDPSRVTADEFAGCWISCLAAPSSWGLQGIAAAFLLFRLFDIAKPWPVSALDRIKTGLGILLDDVAAGVIAAVVLLLLDMVI
ncbi:phosphatidylglycerophosphatase A [Candidatus Fermentibacteria bacterium]|nr:MAG: phosphatidylglycerophosphatase A [Candidatus Fermentibacteria bacterium]